MSTTAQWDCNVYLLVDGDDAILIDSGCGIAQDLLLHNIRDVLEERTLSGIYLTHSHADHAAGAAGLAESLGAPVFAHTVAADRLSRADEVETGLAAARAIGLYPPGLAYSPISISTVSFDAFAFGSGRILPVATGAHSADHVVYIWIRPDEVILFSGDLIFADGSIAPQPLPDYDADALLPAIESLPTFLPGRLLAGHGEPTADDALAILVDAAARRRSGLPWRELA